MYWFEKYTSLNNCLKVITKTDPTPGLPYISSLGANQSLVFRSIQIALEKIDKNDKDILGIKNLVWIDKCCYLKYSNPPSKATTNDGFVWSRNF